MKSTDKYYNLSQDTVFKTQSQIMDVIGYASEAHHLTMEDINALGRILAYGKASGDTSHYEHAVDFLWMASRIEINHKMLLLDLLEE